jgi:hypothetical protein
MADKLTLLGIAPADRAAALAPALSALPGPAVTLHRVGEIVAVAQRAEARHRALLLARDRAGLLSGLLAVQQRLEAACQLGRFLPADPGAPALPAAELPRLIDAAAPALAAALARDGARHQWDVILRWPPEAALAPRRAALSGLARAELAEAVRAALAAERAMRRDALRAALRPAVRDIADAEPVAEDAACGLTVLVPAGGEAAIEAALATLPETAQHGAAADLRGPLPPVAFAALGIAELAEGALDRAWTLLGLPEQLAPEELSGRWRAVAARLHPDRGAGDPARFAEAREAYRLLERLAVPGAALSRRALAARGRRHLVLSHLLSGEAA